MHGLGTYVFALEDIKLVYTRPLLSVIFLSLQEHTITYILGLCDSFFCLFSFFFFFLIQDSLFRLKQDQSVSSVAQLCPDSVTPWTVARQASLSITNSQSLLKFLSIESVMPSNHLILCYPPIRVF